MDFGIAGKVALVAAGSKGIGFAAAKLLIAEGCKVSICARNQDGLDHALGLLGPNAMGVATDVTKERDLGNWVGATEAKLGPASILVTNTGGPPAGDLSSISDKQWLDGVDSTLLNILRLMRLVTPGMIDQGFGRIVHVTSLVAKEPNSLLPISSTLRAGIMALTRLQATELASQGITVNGVLPGHTMTDRQVHLAEIRSHRENISVEDALKRQAQTVPMHRLATADEIGAAIAFLCSVPAAYITGTNLLVDGGLTKGIG
jgi:3-oxoacyl-[acyl-carrier protein] reductase